MARLTDPVLQWAGQPLPPGNRLHTDIFRAAILMLEQGHPREDVLALLSRAAAQVTDRAVPAREVEAAVRCAEARIRGETVAGPTWPEFEPTLREEVVRANAFPLESLLQSSEALPQKPAFYVRNLYRDGDKVCLGESAFSFFTASLEHALLAVSSRPFEYVNPSPMSHDFGLTREGRMSAHCLNNTGPKVYQVVEFDFGHASEHVALLYWLARMLPLVLIVYSGGKSMHGWFNVRDVPDDIVERFFAEAVRVGADAKMWSKCQFSRLPAGVNSKSGRTQTVVLFEPKHL